jgi:hypothetical protein
MSLEIQRRAKANDPLVSPQATIGIEDPSAGPDDVLKFRLQGAPLCKLRLIHHLDHRFTTADRIVEMSEQPNVGIQPACVVADCQERSFGNDDRICPKDGIKGAVPMCSIAARA